MSELSKEQRAAVACDIHRKVMDAVITSTDEALSDRPTVGFMANRATRHRLSDVDNIVGEINGDKPNRIIVSKGHPMGDGSRTLAVVADTAETVRPTQTVDVAESLIRSVSRVNFSGDYVYLSYADFPELQVSETPDGFDVLANFITGRSSQMQVPRSGLLYLHCAGLVYVRSDYTTYTVRYNATDIRAKIGTIPPITVGTVGIWIMPDEETLTELLEPKVPEGVTVTDRCGSGPEKLVTIDPDVPDSYQLIAAVLAVFVRKAHTDQGVRNLLLEAADAAQTAQSGEAQ